MNESTSDLYVIIGGGLLGLLSYILKKEYSKVRNKKNSEAKSAIDMIKIHQEIMNDRDRLHKEQVEIYENKILELEQRIAELRESIRNGILGAKEE